ncbi:MAG: Pyridoxine 5-phosphate oxidase [Frankiales bacterium]|nr:Pyridoxine 5-phosphate oxidase [Frankiales bacterium]
MDHESFLAAHHQAVLVTLRKDGSPQTSNIAYDLYDGRVRVSVTADRAKTANLRRDPRGVLHVLGDTFWQYASVQVTAVLGPVTAEPGDAPGVELLEVYERISGAKHPDPQEFFEAMVAEKRLVLSLTPGKVVGL